MHPLLAPVSAQMYDLSLRIPVEGIPQISKCVSYRDAVAVLIALKKHALSLATEASVLRTMSVEDMRLLLLEMQQGSSVDLGHIRIAVPTYGVVSAKHSFVVKRPCV